MDPHHLQASDKSVNEDRGNRDFADGGLPNSESAKCLEGNGTWEAPGAVKGDIARMMFYMVVGYEGSDASGTPDLELVDETVDGSQTRFGKLCTLLEWHQGEPVSNSQRRRNDVVHTWQANRIPFIDRPEIATAIWGAERGQLGNN